VASSSKVEMSRDTSTLASKCRWPIAYWHGITSQRDAILSYTVDKTSALAQFSSLLAVLRNYLFPLAGW